MSIQAYESFCFIQNRLATTAFNFWNEDESLRNCCLAAVISMVVASIFSSPLLLPISTGLCSFSLGRIAIKLIDGYTTARSIRAFGLFITSEAPFIQLVSTVVALCLAFIIPQVSMGVMGVVGGLAATTIDAKRCRVLRTLRQDEGEILCQSGR